ncbi:hypothetical protein Slin15195_G003520 [Septoria linicola]|uniref:Uncharacterized protein n=1 Tax=Septoria linicola TaxID=215465 RepID=A0A9Q9AHK9_9PEZI|nr:hypothetical protein Slin14017_G003550 [Septoria linicola]USW47033.1 hypothetical protein Slin15195_G003520 [Septoria linicola]
MPLPPDEDYAPPMALMGLGVAMYEYDHDQEIYDQAHVAPLNIGRGRTKEDIPKRQTQSTPRTLAQTVKQLRLTDYDGREYCDYQANDDARSSYYASSSSSEPLDWPLVNT